MSTTEPVDGCRPRSRLATIAIGVAALSFSACASHRTPAGGPAPPWLGSYIAQVRAAMAAAKTGPKNARETRGAAEPSHMSVTAQTLESSDPLLGAALMQLAMRPTAEAHRRVAAEYRRLGVLDMAHSHLTSAARLAPNDPAVFDELARIWRDWGFADQGFADAYRAVHLAPSSPVAANTLGTLFQAAGRPDEARRWYRRAFEMDPQASYALNNLCYSAIMAGARDAVAICRQARAIAPESRAARNNLGLAYAAQGELDHAREQFDSPSDAVAGPYNMGIVYMSQREFRKASEAFDSAVRINCRFGLAADRARQARLAAAKTEGSTDDRH
jgi:Flp pilus assembly protein TadD